MLSLDLTLKKPEENLALDEALLEMCEVGCENDILRFWEPQDYFVVLGYSNKVHSEVNQAACRRENIPILRRISGGGTVLQGPGCLNFTLILRTTRQPELESISGTNRFILITHKDALAPLVQGRIELAGTSDLAIGSLKFSGNAQRRKRDHVLFHGTFLFQFDIARVAELLPLPSRRPAYRNNKPHDQFLTNVNASREQIVRALKKAWNTDGRVAHIPTSEVRRLVSEKYARESWNRRF